MGRLVFASLIVAGCAVTLVAQQEPTFRITTENVPVFVTVTDKAGRLVPDLTRGDFEITDNGKPQPITVFDNAPQPVRLIVMLDVSGSMAKNMPLLRNATRAMIGALSPQDRARVGTFGKEIIISPDFTRDSVALMSSLPLEITEDQPTPLWNSVDKAIDAFGDVPGRRVILVMSDGHDSPPFGGKRINQLDADGHAQREDVMIYGVGIRGRIAAGQLRPGADLMQAMRESLPDPNLGTVALNTGGGYLELMARDDLGATFAKVADELHHQYLLGFAPPARDGKSHKIEVRLSNKDLKPRARKTYQAPRS